MAVDEWKGYELFVAYDPETDTYPHGYMPNPAGTIVSGLLCTMRRWPNLGIKVVHRYDPESSPPRLISRHVTFYDPEHPYWSYD